MKRTWTRLVAFCAVLFLVLPVAASAATFKTSNDDVLNIGAKDDVKNLYTGGNTVNVEAPVKGDFVGAGQSLTINNSVEFGVLAAGSDVKIKGPVGQSVRVAAANLLVTSTIGQDLVFLGATATIDSSAKIAGDVVGSGSSIQIDGPVDGNIRLSGVGYVRIDSAIKGNIEVTDVDKLEFGSKAVVEGSVKYSSPSEATIESGALIKGKVDYTESVKTQYTANYMNSVLSVSTLLASVMTILLLLLFVYLVPKFARNYTVSAFKNGWASTGIGLALLILTPVVGLLFMVSVLGLKIGLVFTWLYLTAFIFSSIFGPMLFGTLLVKIFSRTKNEFRVDWLTVLVGVLAMTIISIIPYAGGIVSFIFFIWALGALAQLAYGWIVRNHAD